MLHVLLSTQIMDYSPDSEAVINARYRMGIRVLRWPALGPTFALRFLIRKLFSTGFGLDLSKYWLCRTYLFRLALGLSVMALCGAMTIGFYYITGTYFAGTIMNDTGLNANAFVNALTIGAILHFILRIWRSNRHTVWIGSIAYGLWIICTCGVVDGLRGFLPRDQMASLSLLASAAMGLWLLTRPIYLTFDDVDGSEARKEKLANELNAVNNALEQEKAQGKEGEARVHAALQSALNRQFGKEWALLPMGGLLPIEGRIPFTDIDHIAVTPQGIIAFETKDWAWDGIAPVPGDDSVIERRRDGQVERFKNPYLQAQMKPTHLRHSLGLEPNFPVMFAVVFANDRNRLDHGLPENMLTIPMLPNWLDGVAKNALPQINVTEVERRIHDRLDYSEEAYNQFRLAIDDASGSYAFLLNREKSAEAAWKAGVDAQSNTQVSNERPGIVPRVMFYSSLAVMLVAIFLADTGAIGARTTDALMVPSQTAFGHIHFLAPKPADGFAVSTVADGKSAVQKKSTHKTLRDFQTRSK